MSYYAGIDMSLEQSSVCVLDGEGKIIREAKVASEPEALIAWFGSLGLAMTRIGLEAGPLSQWLFAAMKQAGLPVELLETRHVRNAFKTMPVKNRPQGRARHCRADVDGLVPAGALQIDLCARDACDIDHAHPDRGEAA